MTSAPITTPITQLSRAISAAAEAAPPISRISRMYAGSFYRSAEWSTQPDKLAEQVAIFAMRVSALSTSHHQNAVRVSDNGNTDGCTVTVPAHLAIEAAGDIVRTDEAFDLIAGMSLLRSLHTAMPVATRTGIGAGTLPLAATADIATVRKHFEVCGCGLETVPETNRAQAKLAAAARAAIAAQLATEANDPAIGALDRAKRLAIASRLDLQSILHFNATDPDASRLAAYAEEYGVLDDGFQAFHQFASEEQLDEEERASKGKTSTQETRRRAEGETRATKTYREQIGGIKQPEERASTTTAQETPEEAQDRFHAPTPKARGARLDEQNQIDALAAIASDDIDAQPADGQGRQHNIYRSTGVSIT